MAPNTQDNDNPIFLQNLQGPAICITLSAQNSSSPRPSYILPQALLSAHSNLFQTIFLTLDNLSPPLQEYLKGMKAELTKPDGSSAIPTVHLPTVNFWAFNLFLLYLYRGRYRLFYNGETIPLVIRAWTLGQEIVAPAFANHNMQHIHTSLGREFALTPGIVDFVWRHTSGDATLRVLLLDVLCEFWAIDNNNNNKNSSMVSRGGEAEGDWAKVLDNFPDVRKELLFGVRKRAIGTVDKYFWDLQQKTGLGAFLATEDPNKRQQENSDPMIANNTGVKMGEKTNTDDATGPRDGSNTAKGGPPKPLRLSNRPINTISSIPTTPINAAAPGTRSTLPPEHQQQYRPLEHHQQHRPLEHHQQHRPLEHHQQHRLLEYHQQHRPLEHHQQHRPLDHHNQNEPPSKKPKLEGTELKFVNVSGPTNTKPPGAPKQDSVNKTNE